MTRKQRLHATWIELALDLACRTDLSIEESATMTKQRNRIAAILWGIKY